MQKFYRFAGGAALAVIICLSPNEANAVPLVAAQPQTSLPAQPQTSLPAQPQPSLSTPAAPSTQAATGESMTPAKQKTNEKAAADAPTQKRDETPAEKKNEGKKQKAKAERERPRTVQSGGRSEPALMPAAAAAGVSEEILAHRREQASEEEQAIVPYYNNFMTTYHLGPEDVITVRVFNQERYSIGNIVVPPDGRISYPLIRDGVSVAGKTTQQVADEIAKHLEEYIIEPKVTVFLEKAMSARYGVVGDVAQPGIKQMSRRLTVYEALLEAGGVLETGDKSKVVLVRQGADGMLKQIAVNVSAIEKGKLPNTQIVLPGDQIFVPGNRLKTFDKVIKLVPVLSFARIFTGGW